MCWSNICSSGNFSSDRTVRDYAGDIWQVAPETLRAAEGPYVRL